MWQYNTKVRLSRIFCSDQSDHMRLQTFDPDTPQMEVTLSLEGFADAVTSGRAVEATLKLPDRATGCTLKCPHCGGDIRESDA